MLLSLSPQGAMALEGRFTLPFGLNVLLLLIDFTTSGARTVKKTSDEHSRVLTLDTSLVPLEVSFEVARLRCCLGWMVATLHAAVLIVQRKDRGGKPRHCEDGRRYECSVGT